MSELIDMIGPVPMQQQQQRSPESLHNSKILAPSARKAAPGVSKIGQSGSSALYNQPGQ